MLVAIDHRGLPLGYTIVPANEKHAAKHRVAQKARAADKDAKKKAAAKA